MSSRQSDTTARKWRTKLPYSAPEQLAEIARLYYDEGLTQSQIGRRYGISHSTVSRLLQEIRSRGIVEIRIHYPLPRAMGLEEQLAARFGLRGARVLVSDGLTYAETLRRMGILAARVLSSLHSSLLFSQDITNCGAPGCVVKLPYSPPQQMQTVAHCSRAARA